MKKKLFSMLLVFIFVMLLANFASAFSGPGASSFSDVSQNDWFYSYVSDLSKNGIVSGYPDGTFQPEGRVTCGEALKLILLAAGYSEQAATDRDWASGYLRFAATKRFVDVATITDLEAPISRLMIAQISAKALGLIQADIRSPFADSNDRYVTALYNKGIIQGSYNESNTLFYFPNSNIKRSEISAIIWRIKNPGSITAPSPEDQNGNTPTGNTQTGGTGGSSGDTGTVTPIPNKIQYGSHTLDVLSGVPVNTYDPNSFYTNNGLMQYRSNSVKTYAGVDVSSYQGVIDWKKVKAAGIDYAIIRLGYRGYETGKICLDDYFERNIRGALAAGLKVGVYFFSQAINANEAIQEANFVLSYIKNYNITYPVIFDWETINASTARTNGLSNETLCQSANAFCNAVANAGYKTMVYFNLYIGYLKYDLSKILNHDFWLAQYSDKPSFYYNFNMWQYTSSGKVDGIAGNVDLNICFKTY